MIGEYTGERKEICPITVSTYQILTYRRKKKTETTANGRGTDGGRISALLAVRQLRLGIDHLR